MLKRNLSILTLFLGLSTLAVAQTAEGQKTPQVQTIEQLQANNPKEYNSVLNYAEKNGTVIMDLPKGKEARLTGEISMEKAQLKDPSEMGLKIPSANEYYRISGTEKMLLVKSLYTLQQEMKSHSNK